ncbi:MAG: GNAT family N-acetyltransferase [Gammaproteobacteria bacterium]|nr:GNAT family N-acetyltransferase [Gammaproteobacteria bacterium]
MPQAHYLNRLFSPRSVAVIGASDRAGAVGQIVFNNMLAAGFKGRLYPVTPNYDSVAGQPTYARVTDITDAVDLVVIATPADLVPDILERCGEKGIHAAIILSAGFGEIGPVGRAREQLLLEQSQRYGIRLLGPNCLGLIRPAIGLDATLGNGFVQPGKLALVSQSGALCTAIIDWARSNGVGFSAIVSMGGSIDIDFGDVLDYLANDSRTEGILLYIEGIQQTRAFMSALRAAARSKPVIAIKAGRHRSGSLAARSHTGAEVGDDEVFDAALRRTGVVRVQTITQLFAAARTLTSRYRQCGPRLAVVTNGGGPGVLAADRATDLSLRLAELNEATYSQLNEVLPPSWSHGNPVDILGDAPPERFAAAAEICLNDPETDGLVAILTPQGMTRPDEVATALINLARRNKKPVLACWMGGALVDDSHRQFTAAGIPAYRTPELVILGYYYLTAYHQNQQLLLQTPPAGATRRAPAIDDARALINSVLEAQRTELSDTETKKVLEHFHIATADTQVVESLPGALAAAESLGYPVAMKINIPEIRNRAQIGGVVLDICNDDELRTGFRQITERATRLAPDAQIKGVIVERMLNRLSSRELFISIRRNPDFGPVITLGSPGENETEGGHSITLPPLNSRLADDLIERVLPGNNLPRTRRQLLIQTLLQVSQLACELPEIIDLTIDPLLIGTGGAVVLDAKIRVDSPPAGGLPYSHMAIHPYPRHLVSQHRLKDGTNITIRPIRPDDAEMERRFVKSLSRESRYFRFLSALHELSPQLLSQFTKIDYDRQMALIALADGGDETEAIGVARYAINPDGHSCEFAIVIADAWHHKGLGALMMNLLIEIARRRGLKTIDGEVLADNHNMLRLMREMGFRVGNHPHDSTLKTVQKPL